MNRTLPPRIRRRFHDHECLPDRTDMENIRCYAREVKSMLNKQENQILCARQLLNKIIGLSRGERKGDGR